MASQSQRSRQHGSESRVVSIRCHVTQIRSPPAGARRRPQSPTRESALCVPFILRAPGCRQRSLAKLVTRPRFDSLAVGPGAGGQFHSGSDSAGLRVLHLNVTVWSPHYVPHRATYGHHVAYPRLPRLPHHRAGRQAHSGTRPGVCVRTKCQTVLDPGRTAALTPWQAS